LFAGKASFSNYRENEFHHLCKQEDSILVISPEHPIRVGYVLGGTTNLSGETKSKNN
jgi:hypothetical protein